LLRERAGEVSPNGRPDGEVVGRDNDDDHAITERRERDQRIRKLQQMLQDPIVGQEPPDDGIAEPGMVVTVSFGDDDEETFLLAEREQAAYPDVEICSPDSPLGKALVGAAEGDQRQYSLPDGRSMTVTLVRAVPYGSRSRQS